MSNLLTRDELASVLKVSVRTVDAAIKRGLPCIRIGKSVRFELEVVLDYLRLKK